MKFWLPLWFPQYLLVQWHLSDVHILSHVSPFKQNSEFCCFCYNLQFISNPGFRKTAYIVKLNYTKFVLNENSPGCVISHNTSSSKKQFWASRISSSLLRTVNSSHVPLWLPMTFRQMAGNHLSLNTMLCSETLMTSSQFWWGCSPAFRLEYPMKTLLSERKTFLCRRETKLIR